MEIYIGIVGIIILAAVAYYSYLIATAPEPEPINTSEYK